MKRVRYSALLCVVALVVAFAVIQPATAQEFEQDDYTPGVSYQIYDPDGTTAQVTAVAVYVEPVSVSPQDDEYALIKVDEGYSTDYGVYELQMAPLMNAIEEAGIFNEYLTDPYLTLNGHIVAVSSQTGNPRAVDFTQIPVGRAFDWQTDQLVYQDVFLDPSLALPPVVNESTPLSAKLLIGPVIQNELYEVEGRDAGFPLPPPDGGGGGAAQPDLYKWVKITPGHSVTGFQHEFRFLVGKRTSTQIAFTICGKGASNCDGWKVGASRTEATTRSSQTKIPKSGNFHQEWEAEYNYKLKKVCTTEGTNENGMLECYKYKWFYDIHAWTGAARAGSSAADGTWNSNNAISLVPGQEWTTTTGSASRSGFNFNVGVSMVGLSLSSKTNYAEDTKLYWKAGGSSCNRWLYGAGAKPAQSTVIYARQTNC